jgi:endonuclease/exonuclease/phosphatase family protein
MGALCKSPEKLGDFSVNQLRKSHLFLRIVCGLAIDRFLTSVSSSMRLFLLCLACWSCGAVASARSFMVMIYNVENLTGVEGRTNAEEYRPTQYTHAHLLTKMNNITKVVQQFEDGQGPDIILFQELERVFDSANYVFDFEGMLKEFSDTRIEDMLGAEYTRDVAKIPVEGLLLKTFYDRGLKGYRVASADDAVLPDARRYITHLNVVFTRFPIGAVRTYPLSGAPAMMEVQVEVEGYALYLFNLEWPPNAMSAKAEKLRVQAATILRDRLDEIYSVNPNADVIVGGDFNCYFDQKPRFQWKRTALHDVLRVRSDEMLLRSDPGCLYNLWNELPPTQRASERYHDAWATFMQMIVSRGLYDYRGIQYVDNSFSVGSFDGLNADLEGHPIPWSFTGIGQGFSEHFPIVAHFRTVRNNRSDQFIQLAPRIQETEVDPVEPLTTHNR